MHWRPGLGRVPGFNAKGWTIFRASAMAGELAHLAGRIPLAEFGQVEWKAFLATLPQHLRNSHELNALVSALRAAGMSVP